MVTSGVVKSSKKKTQKTLAAWAEAKLLAGFIDVMSNTRKAEDIGPGKKMPAHRVGLAVASPLLNLMSTTNTLESKSFEVELKDDEPDTEHLVQFAYAVSISGNSNNVPSLLEAANWYQIEPVKKMCAGFSKEQIDASDYLV